MKFAAAMQVSEVLNMLDSKPLHPWQTQGAQVKRPPTDFNCSKYFTHPSYEKFCVVVSDKFKHSTRTPALALALAFADTLNYIAILNEQDCKDLLEKEDWEPV